MKLYHRFERGLSIMELIVAFGHIMVGFFTFFTVFSTGSHHAVQTQNRAAANMIAQSYMDEFREHNFGTPAPAHWANDTEKPVRMVIKGRETQFVFHKKIEFTNNAFIGGGPGQTVLVPGQNGVSTPVTIPGSTPVGDTDKVILTITWKEGVGDNQAAGAPTGYPEDNKMLRVEMPVWR